MILLKQWLFSILVHDFKSFFLLIQDLKNILRFTNKKMIKSNLCLNKKKTINIINIAQKVNSTSNQKIEKSNINFFYYCFWDSFFMWFSWYWPFFIQKLDAFHSFHVSESNVTSFMDRINLKNGSKSCPIIKRVQNLLVRKRVQNCIS